MNVHRVTSFWSLWTLEVSVLEFMKLGLFYLEVLNINDGVFGFWVYELWSFGVLSWSLWTSPLLPVLSLWTLDVSVYEPWIFYLEVFDSHRNEIQTFRTVLRIFS